MAPIIYMLANQIATLLISLQFTTVIEFPSQITSYIYGGSESDIIADLIQNDKVLSIKPRVPNANSNLVVTTKTAKYYFYIKSDNSSPHKFLTIKDGHIDSTFTLVKDDPNFTILEGNTSLKILLKNGPQNINGELVTSLMLLPKGAPVFLDGKRIFN